MSRGTLDPAMSTRLSLTGLSPSLAGFPKTVLLNLLNQFRGPNPSMHAHWFGLFRFRSPLLTESHVVFSQRAADLREELTGKDVFQDAVYGTEHGIEIGRAHV